MPGFEARRLCPEAVYLPSNMAHYAEVSRQVHEVFAEFTPAIEPLALDEAFLDITGSVKLFGGPQELARQLKATVRAKTALAVSVGVAPSKLVAKIACSLSKPDGLLVVPDEAVSWLLDPLPIRRLWGVGPVMGDRLSRLGITTVGQLARSDSLWLTRHVGKRGLVLQRLARGEDTRMVSRQKPRSIGEENTFESDVLERQRIVDTIAVHAEMVAHRLRMAGVHAKTVTLKVKLARRNESIGARELYPVMSRSKSFASGTNRGEILREAAVELFHGLHLREAVRLVGVSASGLTAAQANQLSLFQDEASVGPTLDAIEQKFGQDIIGRAAARPRKVTASRAIKDRR